MERMRRTVPILWGVGLVALAAGCGSRMETPAEAGPATVKAVPVTVAPVEVRPVERTVEVVGTLRGWEEVTIGAKRAGRVIRVNHDIGDRVQAGESLVELETTDAKLAVEQAERQLEAELAKLGLSSMPSPGRFNVESVPAVMQSRVTLEQTRRELNRLRSLNMRNAASIQEVQDAEDAERVASASNENTIVVARATLANAQGVQVALQVAEQALEDTILRAPSLSNPPPGLDGPITYAVTARSVSEGQMLDAGADVVSLAIEHPLKLQATVPERHVGEVVTGQPVRVRVAAHDHDFEGTITRINPAVDPVSRTFGIEATVPNPEQQLRPGSFAKASIITDRDSAAITVPIEAIVSPAGVTKVFVIDGKSTAREVPITTRLEDPDGHWMEVVGGLTPTDIVATSGMSRLARGTKVIIREPEDDTDNASDDAKPDSDTNTSRTSPEANTTAPANAELEQP